MIRIVRTFLLLTALAGLFPQMGAAATACRSGMISAENAAAHVAAMAGMDGADASASAGAKSDLACNTPGASHECATMAFCSAASYNAIRAVESAGRPVPECPEALIVSQPSSRTLLPELPPPRA
ncbi:MAG: hypothetical protein ABIQ55_09955 [Gemmatimonadaceae bacterium]